MLGAMSLSLIVGPPNSGKAGEVLARLKAALDRDPVLIVPTLDDADRFERELCEGAGNGDAVLGVSIRTFDRLFEDVAQATGTPLPPLLSDEQRLYAVRLATRRANPRILARSAARPGFARALGSLLDEAQAACIDPASLAAGAAAVDPESAYLREVAALYTAYAETRDALGYGDDHVAAARATAALRTSPDAWSLRPVFVYGFDDLTVEQLELLSALAEASEVTVSVAYEDRDAFAARAHLHQELRERGGESKALLEPNPANTESQTLFQLERCFLRERTDRIEPDDGLVRMEAAGERGQAEQIGGEIARLLADGVEPDEIAVVLRSPDRHGPLYESVLAGFGIPVAVEARVPAARTAVGRGLAALLRGALTSRRAEDVLAFVRTPGVAEPNDADWLERAIRRRGLQTAAEALEAWRGRPLFEFEELTRPRPADELLRVVASLARRIGERPHERQAPLAVREERLELRAAAVCGRGPRGPRRDARHRGTHPRGARDPGGPRGAAVARADGGTRSSDQPLPGSRPARRLPVRRLAAGRRVPTSRRGRAVPLRRAARRAGTGAAGQGGRRGALSVPRLPLAPDAPPLPLLAKLRRRRSGSRALAVP